MMGRNTVVAAAVGALLSAALALSSTAAEPESAGYKPVPGWPQVPAGSKFGPVSAVAADAAGNLHVLHRAEPPLLVFEPSGKFVKAWGAGTMKTPHGLRIDHEGNIWATDIGLHVVLKFDPTGKLVLTLGTRGVPGNRSDQFNQPTDTAVNPAGEVYVSDGYGNSRVVKFNREGKYVQEWGKRGKGEGEFHLPHAICLDSKGRVYVGDRENNRIQVFDADGRFLAQWKDGGAPFGLFLAGDEKLFVADGRAGRVTILDLEGKALGRVGSKGTGPGQFELPHMLAVDKAGALYVAEVNGRRVQKFVRP
jgi:DNA-binding beta-propeller fold protein YncE